MVGSCPFVQLLTVFMYLNDVEAGGGTHFTKLNVTVTPQKGRAVIWPSVLNDRPFDREDLTFHEALPVQAGIKYGKKTLLVDDCGFANFAFG